MKKDDAVKLAHELVKTLLETKQLKLITSDFSKTILDKIETLAKGIIEIENKL